MSSHNKLLVIYNTCGISGRENVSYYINALQSIVGQQFDGFKVILSSCLNSQPVKQTIYDHLGDRIHYNFIDEQLPVNVTFNHSVLKGIENFGEFETYVYIDSGIHLCNDGLILQKMYDVFQETKGDMISGVTTNDTRAEKLFHDGVF